MPTNSNPLIVWQRLRTDALRLSTWARKRGTDEQREVVERAINVLDELAHTFEFVPYLKAKSPSRKEEGFVPRAIAQAPTQALEPSLAYKQGGYAYINEQLGIPTSNPYDPDTQPIDYADWQHGYERESDVEH